jgi:hypothetical protein
LVRTRISTERIRWCIRSVLCGALVLGTLSLPSALKRVTRSFHLARCKIDLPYHTEWELPSRLSSQELENFLSQEYRFLDRGAQSFVFASRDGQVVLKLFFFDSPADRHVLDSSVVAYVHAPEETGLLYVHLNETKNRLPSLTLQGPAWKRQRIALDQVRFALQKRAVPLRERLLRCYREGDLASACRILESAFALLKHRIDKGVHNTDYRLVTNCGCCESNVIEIDFGQYNRQANHQEQQRARSYLMRWIKKWMPKWVEEIESSGLGF